MVTSIVVIRFITRRLLIPLPNGNLPHKRLHDSNWLWNSDRLQNSDRFRNSERFRNSDRLWNYHRVWIIDFLHPFTVF